MNKTEKIIVLLGFVLLIVVIFYTFGSSSEGIYSTAIVKKIEQMPDEYQTSHETIYSVELEFLSGKYKGQALHTEHFEAPGSIYNLQIDEGDKILAVAEEHDGEILVGIEEYFKSHKLMLLCFIVLITISLVSGIRGMKAILALCITIFIVFGVMAKLLIMSYPPLPVAVLTALVISVVNLLLITGKTKKTLIALIGTVSGVVLAGIFAFLSASLIRLSGFTGTESAYLQTLDLNIDLRGILVSGIIIGTLGAVMDVAISIASSILEIHTANPYYNSSELFKSGMNIASDIIGSMINTLILAYSGASLSLILLFSMQREDFPLLKIINMEFIGAEIIRSLAGLFGMILAIPLTAYIASRVYSTTKETKNGSNSSSWA